MIGTQIGNYRIVEKLGEGGMGVVYKGIDVLLDRPVAIKVLGSDLGRNPELVERFRAEAKAQANLNHTNLATLYAFLVEGGTAVMVMEYVEGETFDQMIQRRGPIPSQEAVPLFKQALLGIGVAHRTGIIHRDIKPGNLMLRRDGIVKVMDFGIAKLLGTRGLTRTGTQMGTVAYMSPEQIQNRGVDIRSDIYALGVTLYEMLSRHVPFENDSDFQVMHDHVSTLPPLPTRYYPYIPKGIENVVLKALEKNADARFQTVEEFGAALEHPDSVAVPAWVGMGPAQARPKVLEGVSPGGRYTGPALIAPQTAVTQVPTSPTGPATGAQGTGATLPPPSGMPVAGPVEPQLQAVAKRVSPLSNRALIGIAAGVVALLAGIAIYQSRSVPHPPPAPPASTPSPISGSVSPPSGQDIQVASGGGEEPASQPASAAPATSATAAGPVSVPFSRLRVTYREVPAYPPAAQSQGITGGVELRAWINEQGRVERLRPVSGNSALVGQAEAAAESWRFEPYQVNGQPVKVVTTLSVPFQPSQTQPAVAGTLQNAVAAFQAGRLIEPAGNNALYFARQARQTEPNNTAAINLEQRVFGTATRNVSNLIATGNTVEASRQLDILMQDFPNQPTLIQLQNAIQQLTTVQAQARAQAKARAQAQIVSPLAPPAAPGNFVTAAYHRHRLGNQLGYCEGFLQITPRGTVVYNCRVAHDAMGCHNLNEELSSMKKFDVHTEGQFTVLHLDKGVAHRWDFYAPLNVYNAMNAAVSAAQGAR